VPLLLTLAQQVQRQMTFRDSITVHLNAHQSEIIDNVSKHSYYRCVRRPTCS